MMRPSVILVREWEQQMSSSGCCGRLEGDFLSWNGETCFPERRREMEKAGSVYREVRKRLGESVDLRVVDPRNWISLLPILLRDFRRYRVPPREWLRTIGGLKVNAVVVNGRLIASGEWPDPAVLAAALFAHDAPVPEPV
ncbi:MAG: hypothetical protein WEG36_15400 [Gemmatimonadota bacterium]